MSHVLRKLWWHGEGQDIPKYAGGERNRLLLKTGRCFHVAVFIDIRRLGKASFSPWLRLSDPLWAGGGYMVQFCRHIWLDEKGQDIAEYAVMLAVILVLVIGTVRLIGSNANNVFSNVASSMSQ